MTFSFSGDPRLVNIPMSRREMKTCCATLYESDFARLLLGDSFHPGGLRLTRGSANSSRSRPGTRVLDVASGKGESAIFLARDFGCEVVGVDFGRDNVAHSTARRQCRAFPSRKLPARRRRTNRFSRRIFRRHYLRMRLLHFSR